MPASIERVRSVTTSARAMHPSLTKKIGCALFRVASAMNSSTPVRAFTANAHQMTGNRADRVDQLERRATPDQPQVDDHAGADHDAEADGVEREDGGIRPDGGRLAHPGGESTGFHLGQKT